MLFTKIGHKLTTFILGHNCGCACIYMYRTSVQTQSFDLICATTKTKLLYKLPTGTLR